MAKPEIISLFITAILQKLGSLCWDTGAPCYDDWIPKYYTKATNKLFFNQVPLGAGELCCLTFLTVEHLGRREEEKCSQQFPPIPPGEPCLLLGSSWVHCLSTLVLAPWWSFSVIQMSPELWGVGAEPWVPKIWQMHRCTLGCVDYGYWAVNTPITITFSSAHVVYTCGLLARNLIAVGRVPVWKKTLTEWI